MKDIHTFVILAYCESDDLEDCIKSILNQSVKSNVVIATSTKNDFIIDIASEYALGVMVIDDANNKGDIYNYALNAFDTKLVTIASQNDVYDRNYVKEILKSYKQNQDASIIFTDYYELLDDKKKKKTFKKRIKNCLMKPLKNRRFGNKKHFKKLVLKYDQVFCTSSVTYVKDEIKNNFFPSDLIYYNDWLAFIDLANIDSRFVYVDKELVGKRIINEDISLEKMNESILIYRKLWPVWLVDYICKRRSEKS